MSDNDHRVQSCHIGDIRIKRALQKGFEDLLYVENDLVNL